MNYPSTVTNPLLKQKKAPVQQEEEAKKAESKLLITLTTYLYTELFSN